MLAIYDDTGKVYLSAEGFQEPSGNLNYLSFEVPEGKRFAGLQKTEEGTFTPTFTDIPKSDIELLQERIKQLEDQNKAFIAGIEKLTTTE